MQGQRIHLVRHGEVENPEGILYGRLPNYGLSERGHRMAQLAADDLAARGVPAGRLVVSPLQRTRESAAPIAKAFGLEPVIDDRVIEPWNEFEGERLGGRNGAWREPRHWKHLLQPWRPSWGEPYREIVARMRAALLEQAAAAEGADVIVVSHQLPIWMVHRALTHQPLPHNPAKRRCALSSITVLEYHPATGFREADYHEPAAAELAAAIDQGAV
jgi:broad specificity phosphatase PhoE